MCETTLPAHINCETFFFILPLASIEGIMNATKARSITPRREATRIKEPRKLTPFETPRQRLRSTINGATAALPKQGRLTFLTRCSRTLLTTALSCRSVSRQNSTLLNRNARLQLFPANPRLPLAEAARKHVRVLPEPLSAKQCQGRWRTIRGMPSPVAKQWRADVVFSAPVGPLRRCQDAAEVPA